MNVTVENLTPCKKLVRVELDAAEVDAAFESVTKDFMRVAQVPGFRPGKTPRALLEKSFGPQIEKEVRQKLIPDTYRKLLKEHQLRPVGSPELEETQFGRGKGMHLTLTMETEPDFELPDYKGLRVRQDSRVVTDEDVTQALAALQEQRSQYTDVARPVQMGDYVVVDYAGTCDGKPLQEVVPNAPRLGAQEKFWVYVDTASFIPGFTDQLVGAVAGETRTVTVQFPAEVGVSELVGKVGVYAVAVRQIKEKSLPPLDDSFAAGLKAKNLEHLRAGVRADLEGEQKFKQKRQVRDQIISLLIGRTQFELPESMVEDETRNAVFDIVRANQERGISKETIDEQKNQIYNVAARSAKERVKVSLILGRIAEQEGIKASEQEIQNQVLRMAAQHRMKPDRMLTLLREKGALAQLAQDIVEAKTLDFLELHAQVEEGPLGR